MSGTVVKAIFVNEGVVNKVEDLGEFRNSFGSAPYVWNELSKKYLNLRDFEYNQNPDYLWSLSDRLDVKKSHRSVLIMTYDDAVVLKKDYKQAAADIRQFLADFVNPDRVNHWPDIANIFDADPVCDAIGFHMTSVSEDPFQGDWDESADDYTKPDWSKYWSVY